MQQIVEQEKWKYTVVRLYIYSIYTHVYIYSIYTVVRLYIYSIYIYTHTLQTLQQYMLYIYITYKATTGITEQRIIVTGQQQS